MLVVDVPASLTREQYLSLLRGAGFDNLDMLQSLEFRLDGIYAEVYAERPKASGWDPNGRMIVDYQRNEMVTHTVYIPVVDPPNADDLR